MKVRKIVRKIGLINNCCVFVEYPPSYTFGNSKNKFSICVSTMECFLSSKDECLREVDLTLPENKFDLKGKSPKEILDTFANNVGEDHQKLVNALHQNDIEHIVIPYTKNIYVKNCDWKALVKISNLVNELQLDLTVSGGGNGEYFTDPSTSFPSPPNINTKTSDYQKTIASSCPTRDRFHNVKVGVIDSGCSSSLYNELRNEGHVAMHDTMIETVDPENSANVPYYDSYINGMNGNEVGHGTGVVEIIRKCVVRGTEIYVANIGLAFQASNVECALIKLFVELEVKLINCSIWVGPNNK